MASAAFESVGRRAMGRYIEGSDFKPDRFQRAVTCAILKMSGKWPISKQLLKTLDNENEIGVAIMLMNLPEIPQWELLDFLSCLKTLDTSMGDVFIEFRLEDTLSFWGRIGTGSLLPERDDFATKRSLKSSLLVLGSFITVLS